MTTKPPKSSVRNPLRSRSKYIGRSAATGQFIFKPVAVKGSLISQHQANTAVRLVGSEQK
jgi:hypothetical protein